MHIERRPQCLVPSLRPSRHAHGSGVGPEGHGAHVADAPGDLPVHHRGLDEGVHGRPGGGVAGVVVRRRGRHVPLPGVLLGRVDAAALPVPARGAELLDPRQRRGLLLLHAQRPRLRPRLRHADRSCEHQLAHVHGQRVVGYCYHWSYCEFSSSSFLFFSLSTLPSTLTNVISLFPLRIRHLPFPLLRQLVPPANFY